MRILHLSDLHLTGGNETFDDIWNGPASVVPGKGPFDAVIVSGDLSQSATASEYKALKTFADKTLLPLVNKERHRVVFVPGNHDVDWKAPIAKPLPAAKVKQHGFAKLFGQVRYAAHRDFRYRVNDKQGTVQILRLLRDQYPKRLTPVQGFLNSFYGKDKHANHRPFKLTSTNESDHWSVHVFPDARVAIYGFSSVHHNDAYWHGAHISSSAVEAAREHAEANHASFMRVAVWHHGLIAERGRPDHLTLKDIGMLYNAGFRVGFHGHTHQHAAEVFDRIFDQRFVVISTGSLGAGAADRPESVGNQFSIVRLHPGQVQVDVYERDTVGAYPASKVKRQFHLLPQQEFESFERERTRAGDHAREWEIGSDGIATVKVTLKDLELHAPIALAVVTPPNCMVAADAQAITTTAILHTQRHELPDRRIRFTISGDPGLYPECRWQYRISNAVALSQLDLALADERAGDPRSAPRLRWQPPMTVKEDGRSHIVRFPCSRLTMTFNFQDDVVVAGTARAVVERRIDDKGAERWDEVPKEANRCRVSSTARMVTLEVDAPILDYRYTAVYQIRPPLLPRSAEAGFMSAAVLDLCREERDQFGKSHGDEHDELIKSLEHALFGQQAYEALHGASAPGSQILVPLEKHRLELKKKNGLVARFTRRLDEALFGADAPLHSRLGRDNAWVGLLWHDQRRRLLPAFGRFPYPTWAARFASGVGVAGHAFRFNAPAAYSKDIGRLSLIYQPHTEAGTPFKDYEWIVAVPIAAPDHAPIGVVSFAGLKADTKADHQLLGLAREMWQLDENGSLTPGNEQLRDNLETAINYRFWQACATEDQLADNLMKYAKSVEDSWFESK